MHAQQDVKACMHVGIWNVAGTALGAVDLLLQHVSDNVAWVMLWSQGIRLEASKPIKGDHIVFLL
eukprot:12923895-Prorocentrum_lima.AAC.1